MPSEACAMEEFLMKKFPKIPPVNIFLEDVSIDTAGNAEESRKVVERENFQSVGLLTTGGHLKNALTLFRRFGHKIKSNNCFASEDVFAEFLRSKSSREEVELFLQDCHDLAFLNGSSLQELARTVLLDTIDQKGSLLRQITSRTRK